MDNQMISSANKLFNAESKSVDELFAQNNEGFYVPVYQRPYTWEYAPSSKTKKNINRLFDDIFHGMNMLLTYGNSYTFLGAIILVEDYKYDMVQPIYEFEMPKIVYHIIDGQQRLSTILLLLVATHRELLKAKKSLLKLKDPTNTLFCKHVDKLMDNVYDCIHISMNSKYPKMIRGVVDVWSTNKDESIYYSPIANYVSNYLNSDVKKFTLTKENEYKIVQVAIKGINQALKSIITHTFVSDAEIETPLIEELLSSDIYEIFLQKEISVFRDVLATNNAITLPILRLYVFAKYLLERVALTTVVATDDSYAFSIFEALNTAGDPLTAFETFKPRALENIKKIKDDIPPELDLIQRIEKTLSHAKAKDKIKSTQELIIAHALSECGEQVGKHLVEQRHFMRKSFDNTEEYAKRKLKAIDEDFLQSHNDPYMSIEERTKNCVKQDKLNYLEDMYELSKFIDEVWNGVGISRLIVNDKEAISAFRFLKTVGNKITLAILFRFSKLSKILEDESYFADAVKATASFFALWKSIRPGTDSIDKCYRELILNNIVSESKHAFIAKYKIDDNEFIISNVERAMLEHSSELARMAVEDLKQNYRYILSFGKGYAKETRDEVAYIDSRDRYVNLLNNFDVSINKVITKYLLMLSDPNTDALTIWDNDAFPSAVQILTSTTKGLTVDVEEHIRMPNYLGNYILFPKAINNEIENKSWQEKIAIFRLYQSNNPEDIYELSKRSGLNVEILKETLKNTPKTSINLDPYVSEYENIQKRTVVVSNLVWDKLAIDYLGFPN